MIMIMIKMMSKSKIKIKIKMKSKMKSKNGNGLEGASYLSQAVFRTDSILNPQPKQDSLNSPNSACPS